MKRFARLRLRRRGRKGISAPPVTSSKVNQTKGKKEEKSQKKVEKYGCDWNLRNGDIKAGEGAKKKNIQDSLELSGVFANSRETEKREGQTHRSSDPYFLLHPDTALWCKASEFSRIYKHEVQLLNKPLEKIENSPKLSKAVFISMTFLVFWCVIIACCCLTRRERKEIR